MVFEPRPLSFLPSPISARFQYTWLPLPQLSVQELSSCKEQNCPQPRAADTKYHASTSKAGAPLYITPTCGTEAIPHVWHTENSGAPKSSSAQLIRQWQFHTRRSKLLHAPHSHPTPVSYPLQHSAPRSRMSLTKDCHCPQPQLQNPDSDILPQEKGKNTCHQISSQKTRLHSQKSMDKFNSKGILKKMEVMVKGNWKICGGNERTA